MPACSRIPVPARIAAKVAGKAFVVPKGGQRAVKRGAHAFVQAVTEPDALAAIKLTLLVTAMVLPLNLAFGVAARVARNAIVAAREKGIKAGLIRPITLWPFPKKQLRDAAKHAKAFVSVELSMGQMIEDVELSIRCARPVLLCSRVGGMIPTPEEVLAKIEEAARTGGDEA